MSSRRATGLDLDVVADDLDFVAEDDLDFVAVDFDFVANDDLSGSLYLCPAKGPQVSTSPSCISAPSHIVFQPDHQLYFIRICCLYFICIYAPSQIYQTAFHWNPSFVHIFWSVNRKTEQQV